MSCETSWPDDEAHVCAPSKMVTLAQPSSAL
jgi:hypothetical protein